MNGSALRGLLSVLCENVKDVTHRGGKRPAQFTVNKKTV